MKRAFATAVALIGLFAAAPALAQSQGVERYRVKKGDTLPLLAAEYYGNREHKIFIMVENDLDHDRPLRPGELLRIPRSDQTTAAVGDTLAGLAAVHLGDARRAPYLAEFNGLPANGSVAAGQIVRIPLRVTYKAKRSIKLRDVALSLFADASKAKLLRAYNFLDDDTLDAGETISVPIFKVEVQASKQRPRDAESQARIAKRAEQMARANQALPAARSAWREGDFAAVKRELTKVDLDYLDTALAVEIGVLLGASYIAFDDTDSALATFGRVLERSPDYQLADYDHSPKVRAVWQRAQTERAERIQE